MMHQFRSAAPPWWLVPNLLALDAPIVAAVWQRFLAARFGVVVPVAATVALAATVWCIYLTDRWLDARRGALDADRHHAAARYPVAFAGVALFAGCLATVTAIQLPSEYPLYGLVIGLGVAVYLALIHAVAAGFQFFRGAKELLVAVGFAAGVALPLSIDGQPTARWLPGVIAFAGVCWLNCRLIDRWESTDLKQQSIWPDSLLGGVLLASCTCLPVAVGLVVAASSIGLLTIHLACRHRVRAARVLADVVLLSPVVFWCLL